MKDWNHIAEVARAECTQWFKKQCRNEHSDYYWYYLESTKEHNGGIIICSEQPENPEYKLAVNTRLHKGCTIEQNVNIFLEHARRLPILDI